MPAPTSSGATTSFPTGTIARRAARAAGAPYALTAHGTDVANAEQFPRIREATRKAVGDACAVFAVSGDLAARIEAVTGALGERLHVVSAGVEPGGLRRR